MEHLLASASVGPQPFNEVGLVSGFNIQIYQGTSKTLFTLTVGERAYECWCARPLRRLPENGHLAHVVGYRLGHEVHLVGVSAVTAAAA
jgi:hypothetical protein